MDGNIRHQPFQFQILHGVYKHVDLFLVGQVCRDIPDARIQDFWVEHAHVGCGENAR